MPMNQSSKFIITIGILILPIAIVGVLVCRPIVKSFSAFDDSPKMMGAEFSSPTNPTNKILFVDDGANFIDREFFLYAEPANVKPQFIAKLQQVEEVGSYRLADVQWTKDGQVAVCSLILRRGNENDEPPASIIAYDFSVNKAIVPYPFGGISVSREYGESKWKESELVVQKLIAAHGGLDEHKISDEMVITNEIATSFQPNPNNP
jgi:hypothetical protein